MPKSNRIIATLKMAAAIVDVVVCTLIFFATLLGAYGGYIDPSVSTIPALACMAFPYIALLCVAALIVNLFWKRYLAAAAGVTLVFCIGPVLSASPLHFSNTEKYSRTLSTDTFSVMTFNTFFFNSYRSIDEDSVASNQVAAAILEADPSIVVMQEAVPFDPFSDNSGKVSPHLKAAIRAQYPYRSFPSTTMAVMSKYPVKSIMKRFNSYGYETFLYDIYDVEIGDSTVHLLNVHLQSMLISKPELETVCSLRNLLKERSVYKSTSRKVISKIDAAFRKRAFQARKIREMIDSLPAGPVVVCGDFNDVPGCYAIRCIEGETLHDSYDSAGFGPGFSYRAHRLYFRIDHILYNDRLRPLLSRRVKAGGSDHYPVYTLFAFNP